MREYTVYIHKNLKNEKYYVGMTSQEPKERWGSGWGYKNQPKMWNDIKESDWNKDWLHGILGKFTDKNEALKYEAFLIAMLDSVRNGYNTSSYDSNYYKRSDETRRKISDNHADFSGEKHPMYGKHHSEESKNRIRENRPSKQVLQYSKEGDFLAEYSSAIEACRHTGCDNSSIIKCCKGNLKTCGGFIWKYKEG